MMSFAGAREYDASLVLIANQDGWVGVGAGHGSAIRYALDSIDLRERWRRVGRTDFFLTH